MGRRWLVIGCLVVLVLGVLLLRRESPRGIAAEPIEVENSVGERATASELVVPEFLPDESSTLSAPIPKPKPAVGVRESRLADASGPTLVRGRVVDAHTGAPVVAPFELGVTLRHVWAVPRELADKVSVRVSQDGTFEVSSVHPEWLGARVIEWSTNTQLEHKVHEFADERQSNGSWRLPLDVGWMAKLELIAPAGVEPVLSSVALVEMMEGEEHRWSMPSLRRPESLALFRDASFGADPNHRRWLVVTARNEAGSDRGWQARLEIPVRNGVQPEAIRVELHAPTLLLGCVLDEHAEPWSDAVVELQPLFDTAEPLDSDDLLRSTDDEGKFEFAAIRPGEYRLCVSAAFALRPVERIVIHEGENDLGPLDLPRLVERGVVSGSLVSVGEGGASEDAPIALLTLRNPENGTELRRLVVGGSTRKSSFEIQNIPRGRYEFDVFSLDGKTYPGTPREIEAPVTGLVIEAHASKRAPCGVYLLDASSREALSADGLLLLLRGRWLPFGGASLLGFSDAPCILVAERHRPRKLDSPGELLRNEGGECRLEVPLERGWGRAVLFRDLTAVPPASADDFVFCPPLAGARVLADGREIARSDATGLALLSLEREPTRLTFECAGYRTISSQTSNGVQLVLMARE